MTIYTRTEEITIILLILLMVIIVGYKFEHSRQMAEPLLFSQPPEAFLIDINQADWRELDLLPGIGPALAKEIAKSRPFSTIDELTKVKGISARMIKKLRKCITIQKYR